MSRALKSLRCRNRLFPLAQVGKSHFAEKYFFRGSGWILSKIDPGRSEKNSVIFFEKFHKVWDELPRPRLSLEGPAASALFGGLSRRQRPVCTGVREISKVQKLLSAAPFHPLALLGSPPWDPGVGSRRGGGCL